MYVIRCADCIEVSSTLQGANDIALRLSTQFPGEMVYVYEVVRGAGGYTSRVVVTVRDVSGK